MRRRKDAIGSSCYYRHFGGSTVLAVLAVVVESHYGTNRWFGLPMALKVGFGSVRSDSLCSNSINFQSPVFTNDKIFIDFNGYCGDRRTGKEKEREIPENNVTPGVAD